jgi:glycosyltransferase involved in cell wall biosynthesis
MSARFSVVVPTYRRPELLRRCITALLAQTYPAAEIFVVIRGSDDSSRRAATEAGGGEITLIEVGEPGVLAAMRAGVAETTGEVVAFTDDDASPRSDWLGRLADLLELPRVGAVGGRDVIPGQTEPRRLDVGRLTRYGKLVGNHHLGAGPRRDVDVLKGVNMAFRAECLALPRPGVLRGDGAEVHFEALCTRWALLHGWRVVYDPAIEVDHLGAERIGRDRRERPTPEAVRDAAHNFVVATAGLDRRRLLRQNLYALGLGSRDSPGVGRAVLGAARREAEVVRRFRPSVEGSLTGTRRLLNGLDGSLMISCAELRSSTSRLVAA